MHDLHLAPCPLTTSLNVHCNALKNGFWRNKAVQHFETASQCTLLFVENSLQWTYATLLLVLVLIPCSLGSQSMQGEDIWWSPILVYYGLLHNVNNIN